MELIGGALLLAQGVWYARFALAEYSYGTARRMGPGYFPTWGGCIIAGLGVCNVLLGLLRRGEWPNFSVRPTVAILAGCFGFAAVVEMLGLVPAVFTLLTLATLSERPFKPLRTIAIAACLSVIVVIIFSWGLGIPLMPFRWNV